jgi:hypothetical protein
LAVILKMLFKKKKRHKNKLNFLPIITLGIIGFIYFLSVSYSEKWNFEWKGIRKEIKDSIQALDKFGNLTSEFAGYNMNTPKQWHRQNWLRKNINTFELLKLTEYPSGTVKGFAYEELLTKPNIEKYELYKKTLNDTLTFVHYTSGCIGNRFMLSEYAIKVVPNFRNYELKNQLTNEQVIEIENLLEKRMSKEKFYKKEYYKRIK